MTKTLEEIAAIADSEGLDYAISQGYIKPEDFEDEKLAEACKQAKSGLDALDAVIWDHL